MEEISTHVSPSSPMFNDIIKSKEEYETKSGIENLREENNNIQNKCELCGKILSNKKNLKKHLKLHANIRSYVCKICDKSYKRSDHLKRHMITHNPEANYFECELCLKRFSLNYHLTSHLQNVHGKKKIKVYKCPDCDMYFQKKSKLFLHQKNFHNLVIDKIPCYYPYCNKSYISEQKLNDHIQKYHMKLVNNQNNSEEGEIIFNNDNKNNNDMASEEEKEIESESTNNKEKKFYKCPYKNCLKIYSSHYNLSVHIKTFHLKIKSFSCILCSNKYFHKVSLKKHLMIEHKFDKEQMKKFLEDPLNKTCNIKEEIINEIKKNLVDEGLIKNTNIESKESETNEYFSNTSRKHSDVSEERKNGQDFMEEFHKNMINEMVYDIKYKEEEMNQN